MHNAQGYMERVKAITESRHWPTLLYEDWAPQVNGPPPALLTIHVDHKSAEIDTA